MRNQLAFGRAPVEMVLPGGSVLSNTKCKTKVVLEHDKKDIIRLQHVASQIRPDVLVKALQIVSGTDVSLLKDQLRGRRPLAPLRSGYFYHVEEVGGTQQATLRQNDTLLASGSTAEVFCYASEEHPGATRVIMDELTSGAVYVPLKTKNLSIADALLAYRQCRAHSKGLDKITKISQLPTIDYDHVALKFEAALVEDDAKVVVLGSGPLGGTHLALQQPVTLVDPLIPSSGVAFDTHKRTSWQNTGLADAQVIISDVAAGTKDGMSKGTTFRPAKELDACVYVKLDAQDDVGPPGAVIRKPRPHNTEVIYSVDWEYGRKWEDQLPAIRQDIITANERRMVNFFNQVGTTTVLLPSVDTDTITRFKSRPYRVPRPKKKKKVRLRRYPPPVRPRMERRRQRYAQFRDALEKFDLASYKRLCANPVSWCLLNKDSISVGGAGRLDPGLGTVEFSLHSLLLSANIHGFKVIRTKAGWIIGD